jgi:peptidoglycan/LPS O-acetylase OafA/YrhL
VAAALVDLAPKTFACALSWPPLMQIGVWSYSLYLWQQPFYKLSMTNSWLAPAYVVAALACGIASFYLLERPARHGLNRLFNSRRAKPEPAQATPLRSKPF